MHAVSFQVFTGGGRGDLRGVRSSECYHLPAPLTICFHPYDRIAPGEAVLPQPWPRSLAWTCAGNLAEKCYRAQRIAAASSCRYPFPLDLEGGSGFFLSCLQPFA